MSPLEVVNKNEHIFSFLTTVSIVGTIGNLIVVLVYSRKKDTQTSTFFILVLAFSDLAVCCLLVPMTIYMEKILFETDNIFICKIYFFLTTTIVPSSSLLMSAIAFDRYSCICLVNRNVMNLSRARKLVGVLLTLSALLGIIPFLSSVIVHSDYEHNSTSILNTTSHHQHYNHSVGFCMIDTESHYTYTGFLIMPFKFFYDMIYACSVIIITVFYILIYKEINTRRKMKEARKREILLNTLVTQADITTCYPETLFLDTNRINQLNDTNNIYYQNNTNYIKVESYTQKNRHLSSLVNCCLINYKNNDLQLNNNNNKKELAIVNNETGLKTRYETIVYDTSDPLETNLDYSPTIDTFGDSKASILSRDTSNELNTEADSFKFKKLTNKKTTNNNNSNGISRREKHHKIAKNSRYSKRHIIKNKKRVLTKKRKKQQAASKFKRDSTINSKIIPFLILIRDTRAAFMLFVVSMLFVAFYLPSILATRSLLPNDNLYLVYLYLTNSALNPIIYSFMNRSFRSDLLKMLDKSRPIFAAYKFSSIFSVSPNLIELKNIV